jgi:hypothetical protein
MNMLNRFLVVMGAFRILNIQNNYQCLEQKFVYNIFLIDCRLFFIFTAYVDFRSSASTFLLFIAIQDVTFTYRRHIDMSYRPLRKIKNQFQLFFPSWFG